MKKKIIQSKLTKNNNLSKTKETEKVLEKMVAALNDHRIEDIGEFFSSTFTQSQNNPPEVELLEAVDSNKPPFDEAAAPPAAVPIVE